MNTPPRGAPPLCGLRDPSRPSNTNTRGKSDFDVFALLSGDATLIEELASGHQAIGLHPALYLTQLPELRIALGTRIARVSRPWIPSSPQRTVCRPSGVFGPVEAPPCVLHTILPRMAALRHWSPLRFDLAWQRGTSSDAEGGGM